VERLHHILSNIAQLERAHAARLAAAATPPPSPEQRMGLALKPGARVFDTITGQEGEVIAGSVAHYVVPSPER
jgi:hypothetical protein